MAGATGAGGGTANAGVVAGSGAGASGATGAGGHVADWAAGAKTAAGAETGAGAGGGWALSIDETGTAPTEMLRLGPLGRAAELVFDGSSVQADAAGPVIGGAYLPVMRCDGSSVAAGSGAADAGGANWAAAGGANWRG
jgi:hypothetical protein